MTRGLPTFEGTFETHITLQLPVQEEEFRRDCARLGVKPIVIELPAGSTPTQPMTSGETQGTLATVLAESRELWRKLEGLGYRPTRLKIEAGPTNRGLPHSDTEAENLPADFYYEHHLKVEVRDDATRRWVEQICASRQAHLSSNALKAHPDGRREYFVTVRSYAIGRQTAEAGIDRLAEDFRTAGVPLLKRICEYCVYDSRPGVDDGWP